MKILNVAVLRGGSESINSNTVLAEIIKSGLQEMGIFLLEFN